MPYNINDEIPKTAIKGGYHIEDGELYIGRESGGGEVGKINTLNGRLNEFISAEVGYHT